MKFLEATKNEESRNPFAHLVVIKKKKKMQRSYNGDNLMASSNRKLFNILIIHAPSPFFHKSW